MLGWKDWTDLSIATGSNALFLYFSPMPMDQAERLIEHANKHWSDIEGICKTQESCLTRIFSNKPPL